ncbi:MAG: ABC transporter permease [Phycisphaerae bacterium]
MGHAVLALAGKDVRLFIRDKGGIFVTFVFPFVYCIFFGVVFTAGKQRARTLDVVVVDEDRSNPSRAFLDKLDAAEALRVIRATRDEAVDLVRRGKRVAYFVLTPGFGESLGRMFSTPRPRIEIGVDPARRAEAAMVEGLLTRYAFESVAGRWTAGDGDNTPGDPDSTFARWRPMEIVSTDVVRHRVGPANSYEISFPQGIIWGVLGCCASFGISLVIERTTGTLSRLRAAPIGRAQILAGKALACFGSTLSLSIVLFVVGWLFFGVVPRSTVHLAVSLVLISVAFVGIMMLLSTLGRTERSVSGITWAVLLGMAMVGGGMVPRMFMPSWMQTLSHVSPVKWAILAMEGAVWRGFSTGEMLLPWCILLGVGAAAFAIGVRGFAWMEEA